SAMADIAVIRTYDHAWLKRFAGACAIPVINGLTDYSHPCQVMADIFTYMELRGSLEGKTVTWIGDMNNVARSWMHAAKIFGFQLHVSAPVDFRFEDVRPEGNFIHFDNPLDACNGASI